MNRFTITDTVGDIVTRQPELSRVFEQAGIDYCCGGKRTLENACAQKGIDPRVILTALSKMVSTLDRKETVDVAAMSLANLADHIEKTHHGYLKQEFPRLDAITDKVASVHGDHEPRLHDVRETFLALRAEMESHMMKEERILFPMIRDLEASSSAPVFHCGSLSGPIGQMEAEHGDAGAALERLRTLTDGFSPPEWACNTYRAMLNALAHLESDLHQHVHKENNVLFPRALALEAEKNEEIIIA